MTAPKTANKVRTKEQILEANRDFSMGLMSRSEAIEKQLNEARDIVARLESRLSEINEIVSSSDNLDT